MFASEWCRCRCAWIKHGFELFVEAAVVSISKVLKFIRLIAPPVVLHFSEFALHCPAYVLIVLLLCPYMSCTMLGLRSSSVLIKAIRFCSKRHEIVSSFSLNQSWFLRFSSNQSWFLRLLYPKVLAAVAYLDVSLRYAHFWLASSPGFVEQLIR